MMMLMSRMVLRPCCCLHVGGGAVVGLVPGAGAACHPILVFRLSSRGPGLALPPMSSGRCPGRLLSSILTPLGSLNPGPMLGSGIPMVGRIHFLRKLPPTVSLGVSLGCASRTDSSGGIPSSCSKACSLSLRLRLLKMACSSLKVWVHFLMMGLGRFFLMWLCWSRSCCPPVACRVLMLHLLHWVLGIQGWIPAPVVGLGSGPAHLEEVRRRY